MVAIEAPTSEEARQYASPPRRRPPGGGHRRPGHLSRRSRLLRASRPALSVPPRPRDAARSPLRLSGVSGALRRSPLAGRAPGIRQPADRQRDGGGIPRSRAPRARGTADLRFLQGLLTQMSERLDGGIVYRSPWASALSVGRLDDPDAGYYFSRNQKLLFMFVAPRREEGNFADNRERIARLRAAVARLAGEFPRVRAGVTGSPALSNDEMVAALTDGQRATVLAFVLHADPAPRRLPPPRQAPADGRDPGPEPRVVDGADHADRRAPEHLLRDVHLHRGRDRHRLRHLLPLPLRGGARARRRRGGSARDDRAAHRARHGAGRRHRGREPSWCSS